ncbi:IS30 family transposase, partial [Actinomyces sp. MRS3W]|uniref:IS30 family transposase n=1 Tax=Actinomyces sp. MRS3W TaxID=2800796 RepID=UPI0028FD8EDC
AMIATGLAQGDSAAQIARRIGRCRQTVSREIRRGAGPDGAYRPGSAQMIAQQRLARPKTRKLDANPALRERVITLLEDRVSPRQIAARLRFENPDDRSMRICHEQIYQALYVQGAGSLRAQLKVEKALRSGRTARIPRSPLAGLPAPNGKSWIKGATISLRPPQADDRAIPGHWEGDLIIGGDKRSALITLVERRSRFVLIGRLGDNHRTQTVTDALQEMIASLPQAIYTTITWDQGSEMADHAAFTTATDIKIFFADPHSPWQRPTNDNTNGLIREYYPKGTNFSTITDTDVQAVQDQLNRRPREVLQGQTPTEILNTIINGATTP